MNEHAVLIESFAVLRAVIDPVGSVPVFLPVTKRMKPAERKQVTDRAILVAFGALLFFVIAGEILLNAVGGPLSAFEISGGIILFLFAPNNQKSVLLESGNPSHAAITH